LFPAAATQQTLCSCCLWRLQNYAACPCRVSFHMPCSAALIERLSCRVSSSSPAHQILEYHHKRSQPSQLQPQLPTLHRLSASSILLAGGSDAGSRPGTPGSAAGGGGGGRRLNLFEALLRSQSQAAWADGNGGSAAGAGGGEGSVRGGSGSFGGAAGAPAGLLSKSASMSDARSSFDSRPNSLSRQGGGGGGEAGGGRRWAGWAWVGMLRGLVKVLPKGWQPARLAA